jgi:general secretion pathway protein C
VNRIISAVNIGLVTLVIFWGVKLFYSAASAPLVQAPIRRRIARKAKANPQRPTPPLSDYQTILGKNLFNAKIRFSPKDAGQPPEPETSIESLEPTDLELELWGTIAGSPGNSYAIIAQKGGSRRNPQQDLYRPGDTIQNAVIKRVLRGKVVLSVEGTDQVLAMSERAQRAASVKPAVPPVRQRRTLTRSTINKALQDFDQVAQQAALSPRPDGFQISRIQSRSIFRSMGLRNGDVITSVNGRPIFSLDDVLSIYRDVSTGSKFSLELKRRGRPRRIEYLIR